LTKIEAAFHLKDKEIFLLKCCHCSSDKFTIISCLLLTIDAELLVEWLNNPSYFFLSQDEESTLRQG